MKGLCIAVQFLTRLPAPSVSVSNDAFGASMRWFPVVGLIVGGIVAAAGWAGAHVDSWTGALAALAAWILVTGALHLDGLGDMADASGAAHKDRDRLRAVLADPHVGSFGVTAITLQLLAKLVLLHALIDHRQIAALVLVPFAARIAPLFWTRWIAPLHQGLGARFAGAIRPTDIAFWTLALLATAWFHPALLAIVPVIVLWGRWITRRIGGISGDGHGAGIELIETALLLGLCVETAL
ncbi:adenosylcobinamide-GDP ribazoletransferase [Novosphingobium olei]|uniref:Adenosylcobinamide-GDP ribazoletransferase n=1 Tax=Novosphingobium olei TaxID=2728851 RepID=A0A7Y0BST2_9SPHN|nr:adenosylcobinamide-GDP ribazoletransferase [Novosphingobium olei]NML95743.1 adenosylcobinamide-GDP ribazoletransferase [Novosphingobium olei]